MWHYDPLYTPLLCLNYSYSSHPINLLWVINTPQGVHNTLYSFNYLFYSMPIPHRDQEYIMMITIKTNLTLESAEITMNGDLILELPVMPCTDTEMDIAQDDLHRALKHLVQSGAVLGSTDLDINDLHEEVMQVAIRSAVLQSLTV